MKIYDFRAYAISEITEMVKGYRDCKIILNLWQYLNIPQQVLQLCYYRGIIIDINTYDKEEWLGVDYSSVQPSITLGLPYSVNFVEKHKRTTLVWNSAFKFKGFETTKSEAHDEKFDYLYGFLMAYFKMVHRGMSKTQLKKYLNVVVYPMTKKEQTAFLQGVFYENCGLGFKEAKEYLEKIKVKK